ncbi:PREDICTED: uncharacterized protein LOC109581414 [Amphimedon queenslandica]|uniref:Thioredoxin domain-containing protein n=1 Tax=Amphimedon queenslandica TaxID=400682 RepID=A0A1X7V1N0_AMPQE|nr:PREDICTED: uncharacterized protein LOC109581414 [Amphimedon queenslandica]|eukprot:XP_019851055.1 PREDICTED: uncharacterized protein LOC109581414 [Amphimedon queenslandica]
MLKILSLLFSLSLLARGADLGVSITFCIESSIGEWRHDITSALEGSSVYSIGENSCNIETITPTVLIVGPQKDRLLVEMQPHERRDSFTNRIIRMVASYRVHMPTDSKQFDKLIDATKDTVVAYSIGEDSPEYNTFCHAVLSNEVPSSIEILVVGQSRLLSPHMQSSVRDNFHFWVVSEGKWTELHLLRHHSPMTLEAKKEIISFIRRLSYPAILQYSPGSIERTYKDSGLSYVLVFHHETQLKEILNEYVTELSQTFRPHFAFITINGDKYEEKMSQYYLNMLTNLPYIIIQEPDQNDGVHINSQYIDYTLESLTNLLKSLINPDHHVREGVTNREDISFAVIHSSQLSALRDVESPVIAILCNQGSKEVDEYQQILKKAINEVHDIRERLLSFIVETEDIQDVKMLGATVLPTVLIKYYQSHHFEVPKLVGINLLELIELMTALAKGTRNDDPNEHYSSSLYEDTSHDLKQFYDSFPVLREDETAGHLYGYTTAGPLPLLTSDNVTSFTESTNPAVIGFFLPYCLQCRPMLLHLIDFYEEKEENVQVGVVNCAAYTDVCSFFDISIYPTVKIRKEGENNWRTFEGIFTTKSLTAALNGTTGATAKRELDVASLLQVDMSSSISIYFTSSYKLTGFEERIINEIKRQKIYWININKRPNLLEKLAGANFYPCILHIDYNQKIVYHLSIETATKLSDIDNFLLNIEKGKQPIYKTLGTVAWLPSKPRIHFPSQAFKEMRKVKETRKSRDEYEQPPPPPPATSDPHEDKHHMPSHNEL